MNFYIYRHLKKKLIQKLFILHAHEILKETSFEVAIHSRSGDADILLLNLVHLCKYKERIYTTDRHGKYLKTHKTKSIIFEDEIINSLIEFHVLTENDYISSLYKKAKAACFKILQDSSKL